MQGKGIHCLKEMCDFLFVCLNSLNTRSDLSLTGFVVLLKQFEDL